MDNLEKSGADSQSAVERLAAISRFNGVAIDRDALKSAWGNRAVSCEDAVRAAKRHGLKARTIKSSIKRLENTPLPAVAWDINGQLRLIHKVADDRVL